MALKATILRFKQHIYNCMTSYKEYSSKFMQIKYQVTTIEVRNMK